MTDTDIAAEIERLQSSRNMASAEITAAEELVRFKSRYIEKTDVKIADLRKRQAEATSEGMDVIASVIDTAIADATKRERERIEKEIDRVFELPFRSPLIRDELIAAINDRKTP